MKHSIHLFVCLTTKKRYRRNEWTDNNCGEIYRHSVHIVSKRRQEERITKQTSHRPYR